MNFIALELICGIPHRTYANPLNWRQLLQQMSTARRRRTPSKCQRMKYFVLVTNDDFIFYWNEAAELLSKLI